ncbi:MAG: hypothetical protein ACXVCH_18620, partial [Bdellovibrionota bacterium]
ELVTMPSASDRAAAEAKRGIPWQSYVPLQVSSATTVIFGALAGTQSSDNFNITLSLIPVGVGSAMLITDTLFEFFYNPYRSSAERQAALPKGTPRERILREREAEDVIDSAARTMQILKYSNVVLNFGAQMGMLMTMHNVPLASVGALGIGAAISLMPLIFRPYWVDLADRQDNYRKRYYGPVASATVFTDQGGHVIPGFGLSMRF